MGATYSFADVAATLTAPTGQAINVGYGAKVAEEGISVDPAEDKNTMNIGADGRVMHSLHASNAGVVTIRLQKVSPINAQLMVLYDAQKAGSALWGNNIIVVRNIQSGDISTAVECAFKKKPAIKYAKTGDIYEWTFDAGRIEGFLGVY
jgi:hypothetical protein